MEAENAIEVAHLTKAYRLYRKPSDRLREEFGIGRKKHRYSKEIRALDDDPSVKAARTKQCRIQNFRSVRRRQNEKSFLRVKSVHFSQQLVECLFTFIIAAQCVVTALTDRVDLIDKDDTRGNRLCLLEQITHTRCANADIHFNKGRARKRKERHARLTCNRFGEQCLTGSGRSHKQGAARKLRANTRVFLRIVQKIDHFLK